MLNRLKVFMTQHKNIFIALAWGAAYSLGIALYELSSEDLRIVQCVALILWMFIFASLETVYAGFSNFVKPLSVFRLFYFQVVLSYLITLAIHLCYAVF